MGWEGEESGWRELMQVGRFDLFAFTGMHCLLSGMTFSQRLDLYGVGPVVVGVFMLLPLPFLRKTSPANVLRDSLRPWCIFRFNLARLCPWSAQEDEEGSKNRVDLLAKREDMKPEQVTAQVAQVNEYNAHVQERVWFWFLFW